MEKSEIIEKIEKHLAVEWEYVQNPTMENYKRLKNVRLMMKYLIIRMKQDEQK